MGESHLKLNSYAQLFPTNYGYAWWPRDSKRQVRPLGGLSQSSDSRGPALARRSSSNAVNLFLLGAGFGADAKSEAGIISANSFYGGYPIDCSYPLIAETSSLCFGLTDIPPGKSIEDLFAEASARHDLEPMENLSSRLMEADHYLAMRLSSNRNCYSDFFGTFAGAHFLTFNYDSLPEIFLHRMDKWYPEDGYGLPVEADREFAFINEISRESASFVLHLHGSLCVLTAESRLEPIDNNPRMLNIKRCPPQYGFDPESISGCFPKYRRVVWATGQVLPQDRVIAPIPNKAEGLEQPFIQKAYEKARSFAREFGCVVAVGYSFNVHDRASYDPILRALLNSNEKKLIIVTPNAGDLAVRLEDEYHDLRIKPIGKTLKQWAMGGFRLP